MKQKSRPAARVVKPVTADDESAPEVQLKRVLFQWMVQLPGSNMADCEYISTDHPQYVVEWLKADANSIKFDSVVIKQREQKDGTIVVVPMYNVRQLVFSKSPSRLVSPQDLTPTEK